MIMKILRVSGLLLSLAGVTAQADIGPGLSGLTAEASNASSVYWSPAGITRLDRPELMVQAALAGTESKFKVDESNIDGGDADNDRQLLVVPAFYYAHPLNDRWHVGASLTVPSGIGNEYGKHWSGRYLAEESSLTFVSLAGTVAYKLTQDWSIGGGPVMMYTDSTSKARVNNLLGADGKVKLEEDGVGFGWQLGLMYEFSEHARIGGVYRAKIDPDLSGKPKFDNLNPLLEDALKALGLLDQKIDVDFKVPAQGQLGYFQSFADDWSFTLDALWINMSAFGINHVSVDDTHVALRGEFKDSWLFSAGLKYRYRPDLAFSVGGMHMSSPATDGRRSIALPLDRIFAIGAGIQWQWKDLLIHTNLNYADFGNGKLEQDGGLAGNIKGSFNKNHAVVLDTQVIKRF